MSEEELKSREQRFVDRVHELKAKLAAKDEEIERLKEIEVTAKKLASSFPDEIPQDVSELSFNIPAYIVEKLRKALKGG